MHLAIEVPNTWYRASWSWWDGDGGARRVTGVTLPGMPVLVVGSTGRVAWGFSNSFVDVTDLVDLELDPSGAHPAYGSLAELAPARPAAGKVSP